MKVPAYVLALLCFVSAAASAQSAQVMDGIIATHEITLSQASYLVFFASGKLTEEDSPEKAYALLLDFGWLKGAGISVLAMKSSEYAYLLARSFHLPAGILSTLFPGPRYAYRDLVSQGFFSPQGDPDEPLTGVEAVRILSQVMESRPNGGGS